jgi:hypothetical protein
MVKICLLFSRPELSSTYHAITAHTIYISWQNSGWGNNALLVWKHGVHVLECLLHLQTWTCHGPSHQLHYPMQPDWRSLHLVHGSTTTCLFVSGVYGWCGGMGWVRELAHSIGVHTCHNPDCMNLVPVLLTWHSTLYNQYPLHNIATYKYRIFWEGYARYGAEYQKDLLQLPLKLTLSARLLHCLLSTRHHSKLLRTPVP